MQKRSVIVRPALASRPLPPGHAALDAVAARALRCVVGDQIRVDARDIGVPGGGEAMFTLVDGASGATDPGIRIGAAGRARLGDPAALLGRPIVASFPPAAAGGGLVEWAAGPPGNRLIAIAPHGGAIEAGTGAQARRVAELLNGAAWGLDGTRDGGGAGDAWHVPSGKIAPSSFLLLAPRAAQRYGYALAFHGMSGAGVLIGGRASSEIKRAARDAIAAALPAGTPVRIAAAGDDIGGADPHNIVNRLAAGGDGLQIEQSLAMRERYATAIADAVAAVYARLLGVTIDARPALAPAPAPAPASVGTRVLLTVYVVSQRPDGDLDEVPIRECGTGKLLTMASRKWFADASIEETARYRDAVTGRMVTINTGAQGAGGCWQRVDADHPWGMGITDPTTGEAYALDPFRSVATDPRVFPTGRWYILQELIGMECPDVGSGVLIHDGRVRAVDVGPAIVGRHVDWFVATHAAWKALAAKYGSRLDHMTVTEVP